MIVYKAICTLCGFIRVDVLAREYYKDGLRNTGMACNVCQAVTNHKIQGYETMPEETLNPELNKVTPSKVEGAKEESPRPALLAGISEEHLGMALSVISDVSTALTDIPAQIELLSRCTLAQAFVYRNENEQTIFSRDPFERAWSAICDTDEKAG